MMDHPDETEDSHRYAVGTYQYPLETTDKNHNADSYGTLYGAKPN